MSDPGTPDVLPAPALAVKFSFGLGDLIKCRLWVLFHHKLLMGITLFFTLLVPVMNLGDEHFTTLPWPAKIFGFIFTTVLMFCIILSLNIVLQVILAVAAKNRGLVGSHEIELTNAAVTEKTDFNSSAFRWAGFHKLGESPNYLFLYVTESNVLYVPKGCFPTEDALSRFRQAILRRKQS